MPTSLTANLEELERGTRIELGHTSFLETKRRALLDRIDALIESTNNTKTDRLFLFTHMNDAIAEIRRRIQQMRESRNEIIIRIDEYQGIYDRYPASTGMLESINDYQIQLDAIEAEISTMHRYIDDLLVKKAVHQEALEKESTALDDLELCKTSISQTQWVIQLRAEVAETLSTYASELFSTDSDACSVLQGLLIGFQADINNYLGALVDTDGIPLFRNGVSIDDIMQGDIGNCWILAVIGSIALRNPDLIEQMITVRGINQYRVQLYDENGNIIYVDIGQTDIDTLLRNNRGVANGSSSASEEWVLILEAAMSKVAGQIFSGREDGSLWTGDHLDQREAYRALTGNTNTEVSYLIKDNPNIAERAAGNALTALPFNGLGNTRSDASGTYSYIRESLDAGKDIWADTHNFGPSGREEYVQSHLFTVVDAYKIGDVEYIRLRNPWGQGEGTYGGYISVTSENFIKYWEKLVVAG